MQKYLLANGFSAHLLHRPFLRRSSILGFVLATSSSGVGDRRKPVFGHLGSPDLTGWSLVLASETLAVSAADDVPLAGEATGT